MNSAPPAPMEGVEQMVLGLTPIITGLLAHFGETAASTPTAPSAAAQLVCRGPKSWVTLCE